MEVAPHHPHTDNSVANEPYNKSYISYNHQANNKDYHVQV